MTALRVGSLCTGFGALDLAIEDALGPTELVFVADPGSKIVDGRDGHPDRWDDGPVKLLAHRFPGVPNLGDISVVDWATVPPVDVLAAGFPCTDLSLAGKQEGLIPGNRSGVWFSVVRAIKELKPLMVIIENVGGLLSARAHSDVEPCPWCVGDEPGGANGPVLRALGCVLGDLANLGFDADGPRVGEAIRADHSHAHLHAMYRVGKKFAGRELDGRTHDAFPVSPAADVAVV